MERIRGRLLELGRELERQRLSTVGPGKGSCSVRDVGTGKIYVTPSGKPFGAVEESMLIVTDMDGTVLEGEKPSVDLIFHRAIYRARPEIGAVVHLHSPYATTFAVLRREIPVYMQALANMIGGPVPVSEFALPGTEALGENIVKAMRGKTNAVLMANHGVAVCAKTPEEALSIAGTVELAAQVAQQAMAVGSPVLLTSEEIEGARSFYAKKFFVSKGDSQK